VTTNFSYKKTAAIFPLAKGQPVIVIVIVPPTGHFQRTANAVNNGLNHSCHKQRLCPSVPVSPWIHDGPSTGQDIQDTFRGQSSQTAERGSGVTLPSVESGISFVGPSSAINMEIMQIELTFVAPD